MTSTDQNGAPRLNILVVDDDRLEMVAVRRRFQREGIECMVTGAIDGEEAMALLELYMDGSSLPPPNLVLLDLNMPRMNGFEFLDAVRKAECLKDTVVFVFSTSEDERDIQNAYARGVTGYISKRESGPGHRNLVRLIAPKCPWIAKHHSSLLH